MFNYALRRILQMIPLLLVISLVIFTLTALQPGDPVDQLVLGNSQITPEDIARLRAAYGLDQPIILRYWFWLTHALQGDFGWSRTFSAPAAAYVFEERLPNTLLLTLPALVLSTLIAVPLGIFSAVRQYSILDYLLTFFSFVSFSAPIFWIGAMALWLFAIYLPQLTGGLISLPPGGLGSPDLAPDAGVLGGGRRQAQVPDLAAEHPDAARDRGDFALSAGQHAGSAQSGFRPHGAGQGPAEPQSAVPPRPQKRGAADRDAAGPLDSGPVRRRGTD